MAQCFEFMERKTEALKCYEKAHRCGDRERMALPRLARLHQELGEPQQAAMYYEQMVAALKFLMGFYQDEGRLSECEACANQLLDTAGPEKDEAKAVLRGLRMSSGTAA